MLERYDPLRATSSLFLRMEAYGEPHAKAMNSGNIRSFDIPMSDGTPATADLYLPQAGRAGGIVVLCHGFKGHRKWGFFPELCSRLRDAGLAALSVDFSLNGYVGNEADGRRQEQRRIHPGTFRKNTISREFNDLSDIIQYISKTRLDDRILPDAPIGLYGHSRGARSVILHALESDMCRAICTWATTSDPNFYSDHQKNCWRRKGFYEFTDSKTGSSLALDIGYLEDLESNADRFCLLGRIHRLRVPHLLVHGTMDLVVPAACSERMYCAETDSQQNRLLLLQTGHTFGFTNSSGESSSAFETACGETVRWFQTYLTHGS
ncbi:MAG: hypothetical protein ABIA59_09090 [Candidatus Latescibacterota bacterium]